MVHTSMLVRPSLFREDASRRCTPLACKSNLSGLEMQVDNMASKKLGTEQGNNEDDSNRSNSSNRTRQLSSNKMASKKLRTEQGNNEDDSNRSNSSNRTRRSSSKKKMKEVMDVSPLPLEMLEVISQKLLSFDDLFNFSGVCTLWSGYLIMAGANKTLRLINPFRRKEKLKNAPDLTSNLFYHILSCAGELLVVRFEPNKVLDVYKIDWETMSYVKLENLGDMALFHSSYRCYALANPGEWGYESNRVYHINWEWGQCEVYSGSNNELMESFLPAGNNQVTGKSKPSWMDWCFQNQHDEVDYSLVE
ncbi:hypothetical protein P8452_60136 [Trifolium repens]|nr:hypothetical protein P8452_60136 [Trifolium repens]